jgi:hypothetical protein
MRLSTAVLAIGLLSFGACAPQAAASVSASAAIRSAQSSVDDLNRASQPYAEGMHWTAFYKTSSARRVTDSAGDVVTIDPAPPSAWVVEFSAPASPIYGFVRALAVVDAQTGFVSGSGLWKRPTGSPSKGP